MRSSEAHAEDRGSSCHPAVSGTARREPADRSRGQARSLVEELPRDPTADLALAREWRWFLFHVVTSLVAGVALAVFARGSRLHLWWANLLVVPAMGVVSGIGSLLVTAAFARLRRGQRERISASGLVNVRVVGTMLTVWPLQTLCARALVGRAWWPRQRSWVWVYGLLPVPLYVALLLADESQEETAAVARQLLIDPLVNLGSDRALTRDLVTLRGVSRPFTLVAFDLDGFKGVNDTLGHLAADDILRDIGQELRDVAGALVYRQHGDEFAAIVDGEDTRTLALVQQMRARVVRCGRRARVSLGASFGAVSSASASDDIELRRQADRAMYASKRAGRDCLTMAGRTIALS